MFRKNMANENENCDDNKDSQTEKTLRPEDWDAQKINQPSDLAVSSPKKNDKKRSLTYDEILLQLDEKIKNLMLREDFRSPAARPDLKFIQRQTRYSPDIVIHRRISDKIVKLGIAHVYMKVWTSVNNIDYLHKDNLAAFKNLQTIISIVWNCTDKSTSLCECLVKCGVVQLSMEELCSDKLAGSDLTDDNELYLVKAYLGMLHNIVRLLPESRKIFRSANAVKVLQGYVQSNNSLVKAKAYLILSYLINEEENDLINATDENLAFLIKILKEALSSENHFAQSCAFWAYEIADGLNHLAVNDVNKIAMGRLGALPLYINMLQGDNLEEQNLGTAGLWILAFKDENKLLLKEEPGCLEALRSLAMNSPQESIRRAARGALWVVRTVPDTAILQHVNEDALAHVMVSYHHKSAQRIMVKVKNRLRAAGYKVWMDVDNMFGSTLESMALAVEKACVVLVCMTQGYKDSPSCRTEAEYLYRLKKDIVPLVLQPGYDPDGWLGALVGSRLHYDFSREELIPTEMPKLIRELGNKGKLPNRVVTVQEYYRDCSLDGISSLPSDTASSAGASMSPRSLHGYSRDVSVTSVTSETSSVTSVTSSSGLAAWGHTDVRMWLDSHNLSDVAHLFERFTGDLLLQLQKMMKAAPEHYYHTLEKQLNFDLLATLKFSKALEELR